MILENNGKYVVLSMRVAAQEHWVNGVLPSDD